MKTTLTRAAIAAASASAISALQPFSLSALCSDAPPPPPRPNIILILVDDMGYGDIGPFGSKKNRTPNLDRMAREGLKLTSFYAAPVCTPSRAQFMTGCYAKRVSLNKDVLFPSSATGLNPKEHTVAALLKEQGYDTMIVGKWHLGDQPPFLPTRLGFDAFFGLPYSNDMGGSLDAGPKAKRPPLPLMRDAKPVEIITPEKQDYLEQRYTDAALKFIHAHAAAAAKPFFLYFAHTAVHLPLHPGPNFRGKSANGAYGDWIEEMDWSVGRVLDALRELKLADNTLVFFTSDNGPRLGSAGPFRGMKGSTYEGGMRESTIAWWPGKVPAGASTGAITDGIDILPTFVALAGGSVPSDNKIDGVDITPVLLGKTSQSTREAHYYFNTNDNALNAVRAGPWKLFISPQAGKQNAAGKKSGSPKRDTKFTPQLYNLDTDIGETTDIAAQHPDIVKRLQTLAAEMDKDLGKTPADGPGVRPPGRVENPVSLWLPGQKPSKQTIEEHYD